MIQNKLMEDFVAGTPWRCASELIDLLKELSVGAYNTLDGSEYGPIFKKKVSDDFVSRNA